MKEKIQAPKGTKDVIPTESYKWQYIENILRKTAKEFGFNEIRFPTFEYTQLFERGVGDTTDVVQKEMYTFIDKGDRSITLRPEGTASVVRSFIENSLYGAGLPVKCYYIAPNFRYENPQKGRLREHHQFGIEYFGSYLPSADAEVISVADTFLKRLGITNIVVRINSIGCPKCRVDYHNALKEYFGQHRDKLCDTCNDRFDRNPMRILDCKSPVCQKIAENAPRTIDYLCDDCKTSFNKLQQYLTAMNINYEIDSRIVRGLDYYRGTVFEFVSTVIGAQSTVCGGGRYDGLVEQLGGKPCAGIGFGSGIERLLMTMEALDVNIPKPDGVEIFVANIGEKADVYTQELVCKLRRKGISAERDTCGRSLKAQMKYADKIQAKYSLVLGDDEINSGLCKLKNMDSGETTEIKIDDLLEIKIEYLFNIKTEDSDDFEKRFDSI